MRVSGVISAVKVEAMRRYMISRLISCIKWVMVLRVFLSEKVFSIVGCVLLKMISRGVRSILAVNWPLICVITSVRTVLNSAHISSE